MLGVTAADVGGPTAAAHLQFAFNKEESDKRKAIDELPGKPYKFGRQSETAVVELPHQPEKDIKYIFDRLVHKREEHLQLDTVQSNVEQGRLVFQPPSLGKYVTSYSQWEMLLVFRIESQDGNAYRHPDDGETYRAAIAGGGGIQPAPERPATHHLQLKTGWAQNLLKSVSVKTDQFLELNATTDLHFMEEKLNYMLLLSKDEKMKEEWRSRSLTHPQMLSGSHRFDCGKVRPNPNLNHWADLEENEIGGRQVEEEFMDKVNAGGPFRARIWPLPGPFWMMPDDFPVMSTNLKLEFQVNMDELQRVFYARRATAQGNGIALAGQERPRIVIDRDLTRLIVPSEKPKEEPYTELEKDFCIARHLPIWTVPHMRVIASPPFTLTHNYPNGVATEVPQMPELEGKVPIQFGLAFITDRELRAQEPDFISDRLQFVDPSIRKIDILAGNRSIFEEGFMDWSQNKRSMDVFFEMQSDFTGNKQNPNRHNPCVMSRTNVFEGQKWIWINLDPNGDAVLQSKMEFYDTKLKIKVYADRRDNGGVVQNDIPNVKMIVFYPYQRKYVCANPLTNEWSGPELELTASVFKEPLICYNHRGGDI